MCNAVAQIFLICFGQPFFFNRNVTVVSLTPFYFNEIMLT